MIPDGVSDSVSDWSVTTHFSVSQNVPGNARTGVPHCGTEFSMECAQGRHWFETCNLTWPIRLLEWDQGTRNVRQWQCTI